MKTIDGLPVVDEAYARPAELRDHGTGYVERDYQAFPLNGLKCAQAPTIKRLTDKEIDEAAKDKTTNKSWMCDIADRAGLPPKDQKSSSYCWGHAPVHGMELAIVETGAPVKILSSFYPCSQIKHGRNEGGSGIQDVKWCAENGTCVEAMWPPMQFKGVATPEIVQNASLHRITTYEEFEPDDHQLIRSSLVQNQAVTVGIPRWQHEIILVGLAWDDAKKRWVYKGRNSWGSSYGVNGYFILSDAYSKFDEAGRVAAIENSVA
jgi:C1A family cysteine protease